MTDLTIPSSIPAEIAERLRDEPVPIRRPSLADYQMWNTRMRREIDLRDRELLAYRRAVEDAIEILRSES